MFTVTVSRVVTEADIVTAFGALLPADWRVVVQLDGADMPDDTGDLWTVLRPTDDPAWPLDIEVITYPAQWKREPHADLRVAEHLARCLGVDVLCGTDPGLVDVDPRDPYYVLALVRGQWHLACTCDTRLAGWHSVRTADGVHTEIGTGPIRLIGPVEVPAL